MDNKLKGPEPPKEGQSQSSKNTEEARLLEDWRSSMERVPLPKKGTFEAHYPDKEWREVPSVKAPPYPVVPRRGARPFIVGNGHDICAQAPTGLISSATGSFDSVTGVTSESGQINNTGPAVADAYSIQLNTNFFASTVAGSPAGCLGWEQFVFANDGTNGWAFIQYWLINYGNNPPPGTGWMQYGTSWYRNSNVSGVPNQPISNLADLRLRGTVGANSDSYRFSKGASMYGGTGDNSVNAAAGWNVAEFIVCGCGGGGQANFNSGSAIVTRTQITYGGTAGPTCLVDGYTAETNNLGFGPTAPTASPPGPALLVMESYAGDVAKCAYATSVGDTHLTTYKGLLYDFQASGDFILAQVDPDFVVQTRQVSGAPTWPDACVNSAVATRMGKTRVTICLNKLTIDDKTTRLGDGETLALPGGVDVMRKGNVYFIRSPEGHSVRATVNATWIDVHVGLGRCNAEVKGLLANAHANVNQIAARDGTVLTNPFNFEQLYHHFADSWRVSPRESLLSPCGDLKSGIPRRPFYARDLDRKTHERALAVAKKAGVKEGPLLDAATLDVAVIGDPKAAQVFVGAPDPIAIGRFATSDRAK